jgi:hypothetical protein
MSLYVIWLCGSMLPHHQITYNDVAFRQSAAAEFGLADAMLHSQLVLCCLSLTLRKVRGNEY